MHLHAPRDSESKCKERRRGKEEEEKIEKERGGKREKKWRVKEKREEGRGGEERRPITDYYKI